LSKKMKIIAVVVGILLVCLYYRFAGNTEESNVNYQEIGYSEAQAMIVEGEIKNVTINVDSYTIYLKPFEETDEEILYTAMIPSNSEFSRFMEEQRKEGNDVLYEVIVEEQSLMTTIINTVLSLLISITPYIIMIIIIKKFMINPTGENDNYSCESTNITFEDVAGIDEEREEVQEVVSFLKNPKEYTKLGARIPKGILLVGEPGTGKTLLAKAIAGEAGVPFYSCTGSNFENTYVGVGASRVRKLFNQAKKTAPSIIFIDEIDSVARTRYSSRSYSEQTLNQLLGEMDGFTQTTNVIVIAATNHLEVLDPAITRPGRFDRIINIPLPNKKAREEIIKVHCRDKKFGEDKNDIITGLAKRTSGMAGAELENILNESAIIATRNSREFITESDIDEAFIKQVLGVSKGNDEVSEFEKKLTAVHEAGHAIASRIKRKDTEILQVSITPRGKAGGYTLFADRQKNLLQKEDLINDIIVSLGGRAAEEIVFKTISVGATSDLQSATKTAHSMIYKFAMGDDTQLVRIFGEEDYNSELECKMLPMVETIIKKAYEEAKNIIGENKEALESLSEKLMIKSTLDSLDLKELFSQFDIWNGGWLWILLQCGVDGKELKLML